MAVYPSHFTGNQIDDVIGLFNQKGLNNVVGIIEKNEDGTFSIADLSWVADKSETVNAISYDSVNKKIIQSIDGVNSDVVSVATLMDDFGVGEANGIVPLNSSSKIDSIFLPSYVDDVLEFDGLSSFPEIGEAGKIYVDITTNKTYRWSGSTYVEISPGTVVTINRDLVSGVKSATITINDTSYDLYAPAATIVPTNISAFVNDSGYITSSAIPAPLIGTTANTTPTQVATALAAGRNIKITHTDATYGDVIAYSFTCAEDAGIITSNAAMSVLGALMLAKLIGNTYDNTWDFEILRLAQYSDLPTSYTDEKLKTNTNYSIDGTAYPLIFGNNTTSAETKYYSEGLNFSEYHVDTIHNAELILGKSNLKGALLLHDNTNNVNNYVQIYSDTLTQYQRIMLPNKSGTIALTSDVLSIST